MEMTRNGRQQPRQDDPEDSVIIERHDLDIRRAREKDQYRLAEERKQIEERRRPPDQERPRRTYDQVPRPRGDEDDNIRAPILQEQRPQPNPSENNRTINAELMMRPYVVPPNNPGQVTNLNNLAILTGNKVLIEIHGHEKIKPEMEGEKCFICKRRFKLQDRVDLMVLDCSHKYHKECIMKHFKYNEKCPICQKEIYTVKILQP
jgi:hypothetical protein